MCNNFLYTQEGFIMDTITLANSLKIIGKSLENQAISSDQPVKFRILKSGSFSSNTNDKNAIDLVDLADGIHQLIHEEWTDSLEYGFRKAISESFKKSCKNLKINEGLNIDDFGQSSCTLRITIRKMHRVLFLTDMERTIKHLHARITYKKTQLEIKINTCFFKRIMQWFYSAQMTRYDTALTKLRDVKPLTDLKEIDQGSDYFTERSQLFQKLKIHNIHLL